jgi:CRP-like cAMP-binding protein
MPPSSTQNRLLSSLAPENSQRLMASSQFVELPIRLTLHGSEQAPRYVYFLTSGIASMVFTSERGTTIELATLGNEGLVGAISLLGRHNGPIDCMMQVGGEGFRLPFAVAQQEFASCEDFRNRVLEFVQHQTILANQLVACNRLHRADARFARWLLMVQDRLHTDTLQMTQEFLSNMLGTRRTTVAEVSAILQRAAAIEARRGLVKISDRPKLISYACECYPVLKELLDSLYANPVSDVSHTNHMSR